MIGKPIAHFRKAAIRDEKLPRNSLPAPAWPIGKPIAHFRKVAARYKKLPRNSLPATIWSSCSSPARACDSAA